MYRPNLDAFAFLITGYCSLVIVCCDKQESKEGSREGKEVAQRPVEVS